MATLTPLYSALRHLHAAAPLEFKEFEKAAAKHSEDETAALITAAPHDLSRMQGRAQVAALLLDMIRKTSTGA